VVGGVEFDRLKRAVALLAGEWLQDGWAAERICGDQAWPGLFLLTDWRIVFADRDGSICAAPIAKIHQLEVQEMGGLVLAAWHDRLRLRFDPPHAAAVVANRLRQDPQWSGAS